MEQSFHPSNLVDVLRFWADRVPAKDLFKFLTEGDLQGTTITYATMDKIARSIASKLTEMGLSGERAVLLYPPGLEYIAGFFGCVYAGVIAVPAYPPDVDRLDRTLPRLQAIIRDCQAKIILTTEMIFSFSEALSTHAPELAGLHWLVTDSLNAESSSSWKCPELNPDGIAFLQYTSGSTGEPKGVILSHRNLIHNLRIIKEGFGIAERDSGVFWLPPYHDMGLIGGILSTMYGGGTSELMSPVHFLQKPLRWLQSVSRTQATISGGPNFAYELCVRKITPKIKEELDLSHWEVAFTGAEPVQRETIDRFSEEFAPCGFRREAFYPCYGLAEGTLLVSGGKRLGALRFKRTLISRQETKGGSPWYTDCVGCGGSFFEQKIIIVRPDTFTPCPEGEIGEIWVKGGSVAQGYWGRPEETEAGFQARIRDSGAGPFLRTGDLGLLEKNELYVTGRLKDLIIIRGENHYPQDIERTVEICHAALRPGCGAAFSVRLDFEEKLVVVQEVDSRKLSGGSEEYSQMINQIRIAIAMKHDLEVFAILLMEKGQISKTSSGKVQRSATREGFLGGTLSFIHRFQKDSTSEKKSSAMPEGIGMDHVLDVPSGPKNIQAIIAWLTQRLSRHVGVDPKEIDIKRPLAHYGLDSKDAVDISGEMQEWLGCNLSPTLLWKYPTIESLANYLVTGEANRRVNN